jgi:hypothetical protein
MNKFDHVVFLVLCFYHSYLLLCNSKTLTSQDTSRLYNCTFSFGF